MFTARELIGKNSMSVIDPQGFNTEDLLLVPG